MTTYELLKWAMEAKSEVDGSYNGVITVNGEFSKPYLLNVDECMQLTKPKFADHVEFGIVKSMILASPEIIHEWYLEYIS